MTTPPEKPLTAEDITNKVRGDLQTIFANAAKKASNPSVASTSRDESAPSAQQGDGPQAGGADSQKK